MNKWFLIGCSLFSLLIGLLIGASHSPVAGVAISSIFGLFLTIITFVEKKGDAFLFSTKDKNIAFFGKALLIFSIFIISGIVLGIKFKNSTFLLPKENKEFIWKDVDSPNTTFEALDWIIVTEKLKYLGYNSEQIKELYEIRIKEINEMKMDSKTLLGITSYSSLLSKENIGDIMLNKKRKSGLQSLLSND